MHDLKDSYLSPREMLKLAKRVQSWQELDGTYIGNFQAYQIYLRGRFSPPILSVLEIGAGWLGCSNGTNSASGVRYAKDERAITKFYEKLRAHNRNIEKVIRVERVSKARRFIANLK